MHADEMIRETADFLDSSHRQRNLETLFVARMGQLFKEVKVQEARTYRIVSAVQPK